MPVLFRVHSLTRTLVIAMATGVFTSQVTPVAATESPPPLSLQHPDLSALTAQAKEFARHAAGDALLLAQNHHALRFDPSMAFIANEFGNPREIVKNAPYTAQAVTESVQLLPDGNRIVKTSTTLLARDGAGRTRQERKDDGRAAVYIYDPIEGRSIALNDRSKTAMRIPRVPMPPDSPGASHGPNPPTPPQPPRSSRQEIEVGPGVAIRRGITGTDATIGPEDVHVEIVRIGGGDRAFASTPFPPTPPMALPMMPRGKGETKSLGTRDFDGIKAEGKLTTHTIPAREIGNDKAIVISSERWFSPELHVVVYAKTVDPRAGETTYRISDVKREEPPAELFRVPADYKTRGEVPEAQRGNR